MTPAQQTSDPALVLEEARRELARLPGLLEALVGDLDAGMTVWIEALGQ